MYIYNTGERERERKMGGRESLQFARCDLTLAYCSIGIDDVVEQRDHNGVLSSSFSQLNASLR